jgi:hypothetical protein
MVINGSFELGWTSVEVGSTKNQIPNHWGLTWIPIGQPLRSSGAFVGVDHDPVFETSETIPECVHKLSHQLPEHEQPGGSDPLILDGDTMFKVFSFVRPFGVRLHQTFEAKGTLIIPIRVHQHGDGSPGAAAWRVTVNGVSQGWQTFGRGFEDRKWAFAKIQVDGQVDLAIDLESRSLAGIDFFIDHVHVESGGSPPPPAPPTDYGYPVIAKGSKLTSHAISEGGTYDLVRYLVEQGSPLPFLKVVASQAPKDLLAIRNLKALSPTTQIIARVIKASDGFDPQGWQPGMNAEAYMSRFTEWAKAYPEAKWWELWNEQDPVGTSGHVEMARFSVKCMDIAEREGYKLALMSYSTGVPEPEEWQAIWDETQFFQRAEEGGHILSLHAYCRTADASATNAHLLRPKWLYENILIPNNCVVPFIHTEYSIDETLPGVGISDWSVTNLMNEYKIVDDLLSEMYYCLGATIYTFGQLQHYNHDRHWRVIADLILSKKNRQNALPPAGPVEPPDEGYDSTVLVVDFDRITNPEDRKAYYLEGWSRGIYVGPSHDEGRAWPDNAKTRTVELPGFSKDDLDYAAYYHSKNPKTKLVFRPLSVEPPEPPPPPPSTVASYRQGNPLWASIRLGTSLYTMGGSGCLVTAVASKISERYADFTPLELVRWLNANNGFNTGALLYMIKPTEMVRDLVLTRYPKWTSPNEDSLKLVREALAIGPTIIQVDFKPETSPLDTHFVVALYERDGDIVMMDPWTGQVGSLMRTYGRGTLAKSVFALADYRWRDAPPTPPPTAKPLIGFNDPNNAGAGKWMRDESLPGLLVVPLFLGGNGAVLDFRENETAGQRVIVNLRFSWSTDKGGSGTLPKPGTQEWTKFIDACVFTITNAKGVWGWEISNEANNPRESPKPYMLTPQDVAAAYNAIYDRVSGVRLSPGSLDPFHASMGDPRPWLTNIYDRIRGAHFVAVHGYTRGPDPALVGSDAKFTDWPMEWQARNYPGCCTKLLEVLPAKYKSLPIYVTELNHLSKDFTDGNYGWVNDDRAGAVVDAMYKAGQTAGFAGLAIYRWEGDEWEVRGNRFVLEAVKRAAR